MVPEDICRKMVNSIIANFTENVNWDLQLKGNFDEFALNVQKIFIKRTHLSDKMV